MQASLSNFYQSSSALQHPPTGQFSPVMTNHSSSLSQNQRPESKSSLLMSQMVPTINMKSPDICKPASSTITSGSEYIQDKSPSKKPANNLDNEKNDPRQTSEDELDNDLQVEDSDGDDGGILSRIEFGGVTLRDIHFQEQLLKAMKHKYADQVKMNAKSSNIIPIAECYHDKGNDKIELSPNAGIYLSQVRASLIEAEAIRKNNWKIIVKETLLEIYGSSIVNYSAKGQRGERPAIDSDVFKGLFEWVNRKFDNKISTKLFTKAVNKVSENKRKYKNSKLSNSKTTSVKKNNSSGNKSLTTTSHDNQGKVSEKKSVCANEDTEDEFRSGNISVSPIETPAANLTWPTNVERILETPAAAFNSMPTSTQFVSPTAVEKSFNYSNKNVHFHQNSLIASSIFPGEVNDPNSYIPAYYPTNDYHNNRMDTDENEHSCESESSIKSDDEKNFMPL
ncbi:uncharacterized protein LOC141538300 [Cotesia typhae]|uniref:uncharacterized protein LOC141538300 n=1 Tax=Cotesia typhae TaxID=2053667 RepID=UPI003D69D1E0